MANFKPQVVGAGVLFPQAARSTFVQLTASRYSGMVERLKKKKLKITFSLEQFRAFVKEQMGGVEDGAIRCPYCSGWFTLSEVAVDHKIPLSRGGDPGLRNLALPCQADNSRKGSLSPDEYILLLAFLIKEIPLGRQDVLSRLEKAVKLAAGARRAQMLQAQLKNGTKPIAGRKDEEVEKEEDDF
jgi:hypothetical protein